MSALQTAEQAGKPEPVGYGGRPVSHHRGISRLFKGYQAGIVHCAIAAAVVFFLNVALTLSAKSRYGSTDGIGTLMEGDCEAVKPLNTILHLVINILSTLVLAGSNYCMQCLSAPSRREVDEAHAKGDWVEIGLPSMRNLRKISPWKVATWVCLALSSLPLHIFYNSAIFTTIGVSDYNVVLANETYVNDLLHKTSNFSFPTTTNFDIPKMVSTGDADADRAQTMPTCPAIKNHLKQARLSKKFRKLSNAECVSGYIRRFQSNHRNVFLVTKDSHSNVTELCSNPVTPADSTRLRPGEAGGEKLEQLRWICDTKSDNKVCTTSSPQSIAENAPTWQPFDTPISYCMSEDYNPVCKLQFSIPLLKIVIVFNALKVAFMLLTLIVIREKPLLTLGDAISSFLEREDPVTKNRCLLERKDCVPDRPAPKFPRKFHGRRRFWFNAASSVRWVAYCVLMAFLMLEYYTFLVVIFAPAFGRSPLSFLWGLGWTPIDSATMADADTLRTKSSITTAFIANLIQPLLSINYMAQNGILTAMLQGKEWDDFALSRKGLNVSKSPIGKQRVTRYLQLPTRYALPMMIFSGGMHYLFSQAIFAVHIQSYNDQGKQYGDVNASVGFSLVALVAANIGLLISILIIVALGLRRYRSHIPHLGSCSLVISAACHPEREASVGTGERGIDAGEIQYDELQWGVTSIKDEVGHCTFSAGPVDLPVKGNEYAGLHRRI